MAYYVGLMSGTSADGIDAVLVDIDEQNISLVNSLSVDYEPTLQKDLIRFSTSKEITLREFGELDARLGHAFAQAVLSLTETFDRNSIAAIGSHGQTVYHYPDGNYPFTLQLGSAATIATVTGINTVADFRSNDIAAGGQGAPLAPLFHETYFKGSDENRAILNIGGIANLTYLSKSDQQQFLGFDTGPGNALIDCWANLHLNIPYDNKGEWARQGNIDEGLLEHFLNDPYFKKPAPKSTGKEYFNLNWLKKFIDINRCSPENVQTTLTHLTAASIAHSIKSIAGGVDAIYACGGGTKNLYLLEVISHYCNCGKINTTKSLGVDPDFVEAIAFAWLAKNRIEEKKSDTRLITGATRPVNLGAVYLARHTLNLK